MRPVAVHLVCLCLCVVLAAPAAAQDKPRFTLFFDNDIFDSTDEYYTNGIKLEWLSAVRGAEAGKTPWWRKLPFVRSAAYEHYNLAFAFGQAMYTPSNISLPDPPLDDRPYAGWLYANFDVVAKNARRMDLVRVGLGVVGPSAGAEDTQNAVHKLISSRNDEGWDTQLADEPGLVLHWHRRWRTLEHRTPRGWGFDVVPTVGVDLGNVSTRATFQAEIRLGYNIPTDFGTAVLQPGAEILTTDSDTEASPHRFRFYVMVMPYGWVVGRNIFLDGNTWEDSRSVDKETLVGGAAAGFAVSIGRFELTFANIWRSDEFATQANSNQAYGDLTVSWAF